MAQKKVLMVVSSPAKHATLGYPVGFWAAELTHAWYEFRDAGYAIDLASPKGGPVIVDAYSDPRDASRYSADDVLSRGFLSDPSLAALLETTKELGAIDLKNYDALYVAGGQGPMFTFREDASLANAIRTFYESGKVTAAVCHGTCALLDLRLSNGKFLIEGRLITGFANSEEDYADQVMKTKVMPFRIEDEARKRGALFAAAPAFQPFAVRDGNLITGQQQHSGRRAAELVIAALGR